MIKQILLLKKTIILVLKEYFNKTYMKIYTSYFNKTNKLLDLGFENLVSIAGKCPEDFALQKINDQRFKEYKKLAPKYDWWKEWHDNGYTNQWYTNKYYETVLNTLDPEIVLNELTECNKKDTVILCWEAPNKFCHRHLVAKWLMNNLKIEIKEI